MAEIEFLPVCSNCHEIIYNIEIDYTGYGHRTTNKIWSDSIIPYKCPYCGCYFDLITIPTKLPFIKNTEIKKV